MIYTLTTFHEHENEIYEYFDRYPFLETHYTFLDILKACDRLLHGGLIFKLKNIGITDNLLKILQGFLDDR